MQISTSAFTAHLVPTGRPTLFEIKPNLDELRAHLDDGYRHDLLAAVDAGGPKSAFAWLCPKDGVEPAYGYAGHGTAADSVQRKVET